MHISLSVYRSLYYYYWSLLYSAILRTRALTALACDSTWVSICVEISICVCMALYPSVYISLSICVYISIHLCIYLYPSVCRSLSVYTSLCRDLEQKAMLLSSGAGIVQWLERRTRDRKVCMQWRDVVVWCTQNAPRRQQFHVAPAMSALEVHLFGGYSKHAIKSDSHSFKIVSR